MIPGIIAGDHFFVVEWRGRRIDCSAMPAVL